jgi:precorrin-6B methylase 2
VPEITVIAAKRIYDQPRPWLPKKRIRRLKVRQMTLPTLCAERDIEEIDILKMDVEASEMEILRGAKRMLPKIRKMVIEWHTPKLKKQCIAFLRKNGFKMVHSEQKKGVRCGDIYFISRKSAKR